MEGDLLQSRQRKYKHIKATLPTSFQADNFQGTSFDFKCKNGIGSKYRSDLSVSYASCHWLRSEASGLLRVPRTKQITYEDWAFSKTASTLWKSIFLLKFKTVFLSEALKINYIITFLGSILTVWGLIVIFYKYVCQAPVNNMITGAL